MNFDLTTGSGMQSAGHWLEECGITKKEAALASVIGGLPGLLAFAGYKLANKALSSDDALVKQASAAKELIEAGKKNGVRKMNISIDQKAGLHFEAPIEGVSIELSAGSKGKINIEVEYA